MTTVAIPFTRYKELICAWIVLAIIIFLVLLKITAPYGRHSSARWGPAISNNLGWAVMESAAVIMLFVFIFPNWGMLSSTALVMIALFCLHYFNRTFVFPFRLHTKGKKMPMLVMCSGILFNIINGSSLGYYFVHYAHYGEGWLTSFRFIAGSLLFFVGLYINWKADNLLIHLRKPNETHYIIPRGWLFRYISCPNLFGELIEWFGFAVLCWNLPAWAFFLWTAANLIPRAIAHHKWYKARFNNYPSNRSAIIPFLI